MSPFKTKKASGPTWSSALMMAPAVSSGDSSVTHTVAGGRVREARNGWNVSSRYGEDRMTSATP